MARVVYGKRNVLEALEAGLKPDRLLLQKGLKGDLADKVTKFGGQLKMKVEWVDKASLDKRSDRGIHQGVMALFPPFKYANLEDLLKTEGPQLIVALDQVEDPRNLGAIIRTAEVHGALGVVIPRDRAAEVTPSAEKTSAGAASRLPVAQVVNLASAIEQIQKAGFWCYGLAGEADTEIASEKFPERTCLVMGGEGEGLRDRTRKVCDKLLKIPQAGKVGSLNVGVAAGIAMYEVLRQRGTN